MTKFHRNKHGIPAICKAKEDNCPLGDNSAHFGSQKEAQDYIDKVSQKEFSILLANQINVTQVSLDDKLKSIFDEKHLSILDKLNKANFDAYIVGGSLRDTILNLPTNDIDITTSATPEEIIQVFQDYKVIPVGLEHGTVAVVIDNEPIEITTFRHDGEYSDNRRPDTVEFTKSLEEDLKRRDFTINALAYSEDGLVDLVNGKQDIENGIIRAVGNPDKRFQEDSLRILRGLRFASKLGFHIEKETESAMFRNKELLHNMSKERIQSELNGILLGKNANVILNNYSEIFAEIIPEIKPMIGFDQQNPHHHLDLWKHSCQVVKNTKDNLAHRLAAVFHDIGKPNTFTYNEGKGYASFLSHAEESMKITKDVLVNLKYDNKTIERVLNIIEDHDFQLSTKPYKIKKAIYELGPERFKDMMEFKRADDLSKNLNYKNDLDKYDKIQKIAEDYLANSPILSHKDLDITPQDLMSIGIKGKRLGEVLNELALLTISGHKNDKESQLKYIQTYMIDNER